MGKRMMLVSGLNRVQNLETEWKMRSNELQKKKSSIKSETVYSI